MTRRKGLVLVLAVGVGLCAGCLDRRPSSAAGVDTVQVQFVQPEGAKVSVHGGTEAGWLTPLTLPGHMDFRGGRSYRVRLSDIPNQPGVTIWGRLTVADVTDYTIESAVPLEITRDDVEDAKRNVLVVKVVFLPDQEHQIYAIPGAPTSIVSTRLEPGKDAVEEAEKQGTVLLVLRLGGRQYTP